MRRMFKPTVALYVLLALLVLPALDSAFAQQPSRDQINAVRQSCRSDFIANCSGVRPGGRDAIECLLGNSGKLSAPCRSAVAAIVEQTAPVQEDHPPAAAAPSEELEPAPGNAAAPPNSAPATAPTGRPGQKQLSAIHAACRADFMAQCSGVQPGGIAAMQCLQRNSAQLSAACQAAVAAIGHGAPAAASEAPGAATEAPAAAPLGPMPPMRPRKVLAILALCAVDQQTLCAGIPAGGGRIISCLAANAPRLSPGCYDALARARR